MIQVWSPNIAPGQFPRNLDARLQVIQALCEGRNDLGYLVNAPELAPLRATRLAQEAASVLGFGQGELGRGIALSYILRLSIALAREAGQEGSEFLTLRYLKGLPPREIGDAAHWSTRTVQRRLKQAMRGLTTLIFALSEEVERSGLLPPRSRRLLEGLVEEGLGLARLEISAPRIS